MDAAWQTWDGQPISPEPPYGAAVVVYRAGAVGLEFLILHRSHGGADHEGDWAWTPPSGARRPGEPVERCATRELAEETGLRLPLRPAPVAPEDWAVFLAQAPVGVEVRLDAEHDRFAWVSGADAVARCQPERVSAPLGEIVRALEPGG